MHVWIVVLSKAENSWFVYYSFILLFCHIPLFCFVTSHIIKDSVSLYYWWFWPTNGNGLGILILHVYLRLKFGNPLICILEIVLPLISWWWQNRGPNMHFFYLYAIVLVLDCISVVNQIHFCQINFNMCLACLC